MIETLSAWGIGQIAAYTGGIIGAAVLAWILKKIPNEKIKKVVGVVFFKLGYFLTGWMTKRIPKFWNKIIEPFLIDLIDNVIGEAVKEFIRGLRSDNDEPPM